jgi:FlaG/FlaF family flagellin (archaellin)
MQLKQLLYGEDAVSPVVSVVLMIAIVVIIGATAGTLVFSVSERLEGTAPQASFEFYFQQEPEPQSDDFGINASTDTSAGLLTIRHTGGDSAAASQVRVVGGSYGSGTWSNASQASFAPSEMISSGDELAMWIDEDDSLSLVWVSESGDKSARIGSYPGPRA